eukprot:CAMPEP_0182837562 /NCGR_PEP_ID=MMETSP0006_2-20121128/22789_1 /TAXON_ID=97485 /ORGANISM="Prymnesium parvum, Strain Texoma1" /LENGTH=133 /DNA_ID=CAMNT_0024966433 /DNA_START=73 /DNA_END=474 /DNA_ORIENTATION=-
MGPRRAVTILQPFQSNQDTHNKRLIPVCSGIEQPACRAADAPMQRLQQGTASHKAKLANRPIYSRQKVGKGAGHFQVSLPVRQLHLYYPPIGFDELDQLDEWHERAAVAQHDGIERVGVLRHRSRGSAIQEAD